MSSNWDEWGSVNETLLSESVPWERWGIPWSFALRAWRNTVPSSTCPTAAHFGGALQAAAASLVIFLFLVHNVSRLTPPGPARRGGKVLQDEPLTQDFAVDFSQGHREHEGLLIWQTCVNIHFPLLLLCKHNKMKEVFHVSNTLTGPPSPALV